jgi:hypothetical protein
LVRLFFSILFSLSIRFLAREKNIFCRHLAAYREMKGCA